MTTSEDPFASFIEQLSELDAVTPLPGTGAIDSFGRLIAFLHRKCAEEGHTVPEDAILPPLLYDRLHSVTKHVLTYVQDARIRRVNAWYYANRQVGESDLHDWLRVSLGAARAVAYCEGRGWLDEWINEESAHGQVP